MQVDFSKIKFDDKGLVPAVVQDAATNAVLMLAYMNGASLAKTVETGYTWFWSRQPPGAVEQRRYQRPCAKGHQHRL